MVKPCTRRIIQEAGMSTVPKPRYTPEEYLARERKAPTKSEYYRGEIFAKAGATRAHILIVGNLTFVLNQQLRDRPCEVYPVEMRVKVSATGLYTYPDLAVVCGEPRIEDNVHDTLLNPTVLIEVLSESTEAYDWGVKASQYRALASLRELILIAQDRPHVERYVRQPDGHWMLEEAGNLSDVMPVDAISATLPLADVYRRVEFSASAGHRDS
jgi:Uma2 family endonuclease